jgi:hypothetical protein
MSWYSPRDTYDGDETSLLRKQAPEHFLATSSEQSLKVQKSRVTITVCGSANVSNKVRVKYILSFF